MKVSKFEYEKHAPKVRKWLVKHNFPLPNQELLSDIGFYVDDCACGFLYTGNTKLGWIEWVFSNPEKSAEERARALDLVLKLLEDTAKTLGIQALFSASAIPAYSAVLERNHFKMTDENIRHYIKLVGG